jgi:glycerophosphoryl diester phosphodiesterase
MKAGPPRLKWHMLRRRKSDPPFLRENLHAGLAAGAALEVDLTATADGHLVCLHDATLDRETSGKGPVGAATRADLLRLRQRGPDGSVLDAPPLFLDEVVAAVERLAPTAGHVQLDIKEPSSRIDDALAAHLRDTLGRHAAFFIAGSADWRLLERLAAAVPGLGRGFDPLELTAEHMPETAAEFEALAETSRRLAPHMAIYYLEADVGLAGLAAGVNLIERLGRGSAEVDCWTIDADRPSLRGVLRRVVGAGCDQITTNDPVALAPILAEIA